MEPAAPACKELHFFKGINYYRGDLVTTPHSHAAVQITISKGPHRISCKNGNSRIEIEKELIIVNANVEHWVDSFRNPYGSILLDYESSPATLLKEGILAHKDYFACNVEDVPALGAPISYLLTQPIRTDAFLEHLNTIIRSLCGDRAVVRKKDPRIVKALACIKSLRGKPVSASELAAKAGLSESRFMHLFKAVTGMPVRKYIRWLRLINAVQYVVSGLTLTDAAHASGFADAAHLSRTFRDMFGERPQGYFKDGVLQPDTVIVLHHKIPVDDFTNGVTFPFQ